MPNRFRWLGPALPSPVTYRRLAIAGWILYVLSWVTPSVDGHMGAWAFVATIRYASSALEAGTLSTGALGLCVLFGWSANLSIFTRSPVWARVGWIAAPWFPFLVALLLLPVRPSVAQRAAYLLYFYPWAAGIALIHLAHIGADRSGSVTG